MLDFGSSSYLNEIRGDKVYVNDDDDDDDVKYVKVFHDDDDDNKLVGKKGKLVSLLPPSSDNTSPSKTNYR